MKIDNRIRNQLCKKMKLFLTIILFTLCHGLTAQNTTTIVYEKTYDINGEGVLKRQLSLHSDGTFYYHTYRRINDRSPEINLYGKGTWTSKKDLLIFSADETTDLDEKHSLNFNGSKARIFKDSSIRFLNSKIPWVKGMPLEKKT